MTTMSVKFLVSYVVLTSLVFQQINGASCASGEIYEAQVNNGLPSNYPPLLVHCTTDGKDVGTYPVNLNTTFQIEICEKLVGRTIYSCYIQWGLRHQSLNLLDSANSNIECANKTCFWQARSDGLYFRERSGNLVRKFVWQ